MPRTKKTVDPVPDLDTKVKESSVQASELAQALVAAIESTKPVSKKTVVTRTKNTPWTPKDGSPRLKLKRKMYHHGIPIINKVTNAEIELLNKVRPGVFCDGHVVVRKRKDKGLDIDYPVRTASQRLKLVNMFGLRNFQELLQRLVDEAGNPVKYKAPEDLD